ncbi:MAG: class I SAM-dependent methyltransferase [Candidatus Bathyarchaeia archaeon]
MSKQEWYTSLFDELDNYWQEIAETRSTEQEASFIENVMKRKGLLLDFCCGTARHSILLSQHGWNVIGLDISPNLLRIAKENMKEKHVRFPLVRGEMRHLPFQTEAFVGAINMFTSFGYLPSEKEDLASLREVARILQPNGSFLVDVVNREQLVSTFKKKDWGEFPSFYMLERRTLDIEGSRLYSRWTIVDKKSSNTETFDHNLRLYSLSQLERLLKRAGLTVEKVYGAYELQEFRSDSPRMILLAKKEAI